MLQDAIDTMIIQIIENSIGLPEDHIISKEKIIFEQRGASFIKNKFVRECRPTLDQNYPNRWIGQ